MKKIKWHELCKIINQLNKEHEYLKFRVEVTDGPEGEERIKELKVTLPSKEDAGIEYLVILEIVIHEAKRDLEAFNEKYAGYIIEY